ncbi:MAG: cereblon family protein [Myxococcota bacterium]
MDGKLPGPRAPGAVPDDADAEPDDASRLLCRACGHDVTDPASASTMSGKHRHTFVNPHGHVFEIGIFDAAPGVRATGAPSAFFSWFPGYAWRVVQCGGCGCHLGWAFGDTPDFFGLILPRLAQTTPTRQR